MARRNVVRGWRAISRYTGAGLGELKHAVAIGELRSRPPLIAHADLDAWIRLRELRAKLADDGVKFVPQSEEPVGDRLPARAAGTVAFEDAEGARRVAAADAG